MIWFRFFRTLKTIEYNRIFLVKKVDLNWKIKYISSWIKIFRILLKLWKEMCLFNFTILIIKNAKNLFLKQKFWHKNSTDYMEINFHFILEFTMHSKMILLWNWKKIPIIIYFLQINQTILLKYISHWTLKT